MDIKKKRKERILMSFVNTMTNLFEIESYYVDELIDFDCFTTGEINKIDAYIYIGQTIDLLSII